MSSTVWDPENRRAKNGPVLMRSHYCSQCILTYTTNERVPECDTCCRTRLGTKSRTSKKESFSSVERKGVITEKMPINLEL